MTNCRFVLVLFLPCLALAACGSSHTEPGAVARVGNAAITSEDVQRYLDYTDRFFASPTGSAMKATCAHKANDDRCGTVRREILNRLIEEKVVTDFAGRHGIRLSTTDQVAVNETLARMLEQSPGLGRTKVEQDFLRGVLSRQFLVQKVVEAVAPRSTKEGFQIHIEKVYFPRSGADQKTAYSDAVSLATDGGPIPTRAQTKKEWVPAHNLRLSAQAALAAAEPGQYVGPFTDRRYYLVIQLLGRGRHAYASAHRHQLQMAYFSEWLRKQIGMEKPLCYGTNGAENPCPIASPTVLKAR